MSPNIALLYGRQVVELKTCAKLSQERKMLVFPVMLRTTAELGLKISAFLTFTVEVNLHHTASN